MSNFIFQVVLDVWYESSYPAVALLGDLYKIGYTNIVETPFRSLPVEVRKSNPDFKYQPMYEIASKDNNYKATLGDNVFGMSATSYTSWENFISETSNVFNVLLDQSDLKITRIGLRYLDMIDNKNIFDNEHIKIEISGDSRNKSDSVNIRFDNVIDDCKVTENIIYPFQRIDNKDVSGTFIDIVTAKEVLTLEGDGIKDQFLILSGKLHELNLTKFKEILSNELRRQINI